MMSVHPALRFVAFSGALLGASFLMGCPFIETEFGQTCTDNSGCPNGYECHLDVQACVKTEDEAQNGANGENGGNGGADAGPSADSGPAADAGPGVDSGPPPDAGPGVDASVPVDAGPAPVDGGSTVADGGSPGDDGGTPPVGQDGGSMGGSDASVQPPADAGVINPDAGSLPSDGGALFDGGSVPDAGPLTVSIGSIDSTSSNEPGSTFNLNWSLSEDAYCVWASWPNFSNPEDTLTRCEDLGGGNRVGAGDSMTHPITAWVESEVMILCATDALPDCASNVGRFFGDGGTAPGVAVSNVEIADIIPGEGDLCVWDDNNQHNCPNGECLFLGEGSERAFFNHGIDVEAAFPYSVCSPQTFGGNCPNHQFVQTLCDDNPCREVCLSPRDPFLAGRGGTDAACTMDSQCHFGTCSDADGALVCNASRGSNLQGRRPFINGGGGGGTGTPPGCAPPLAAITFDDNTTRCVMPCETSADCWGAMEECLPYSTVSTDITFCQVRCDNPLYVEDELANMSPALVMNQSAEFCDNVIQDHGEMTCGKNRDDGLHGTCGWSPTIPNGANFHTVGNAAELSALFDGLNADDALDGDTVVLLPGTYSVQLDVDKTVSFIGAYGAAETIITPSNNGIYAISVDDATGGDMTFSGISFTQSSANNTKPALYLVNGEVTIKECWFYNLISDLDGGAINLNVGTTSLDVRLYRNYFWANTSSSRGGAVAARATTFEMVSNVFWKNNADGQGGGVFYNLDSQTGVPYQNNNLFVENSAVSGGAMSLLASGANPISVKFFGDYYSDNAVTSNGADIFIPPGSVAGNTFDAIATQISVAGGINFDGTTWTTFVGPNINAFPNCIDSGGIYPLEFTASNNCVNAYVFDGSWYGLDVALALWRVNRPGVGSSGWDVGPYEIP
jgi:hypothetical protein